MLTQQYKQHQIFVFIYLELELLEEPSVLSALVSLLELGADHVSGLLLLHRILKHNRVIDTVSKCDVNINDDLEIVPQPQRRALF